MAKRQSKTKKQSKQGEVRKEQSSVAAAAKLQAQAALEEARHKQLCQLLEHTLHRHCEDYLRQLATTAVQVKTVAEIASMQAQLLQRKSTPPKNHKDKQSASSTIHNAVMRALSTSDHSI